jgi:betaine reductase
MAVKGKLPEVLAEEVKKAKAAGLDEVIQSLQPKQTSSAEEEVKAPPQEPTDEELHGVDVLDVEDAVRELWKAGIYAESAMGCTGPVVKIPSRVTEEAKKILKESNYI